MPPFCATVLMELYKMKNIYYIQLFYKNSTEDPMPLFIPSCGVMCPMRKFREIYDRIIPIGNFDEECHMEDETSGFEMDVDDENSKKFISKLHYQQINFRYFRSATDHIRYCDFS